MRRYLLSTLFFTSLASLPAAAQNYIPARDYSGAGIIVNMDVLSGSQPGSLYGNAPTMVRDLPPPPRFDQSRIAPPTMAPRPALRAPMALSGNSVKPAAAPMRAPAPKAETAPAARKYTSPLAPIKEDEPVKTAEPKIQPKPELKPEPVKTVSKLPAPAPLSSINDLVSDDMPTAKTSSGNRQELASFHEPIINDSIGLIDQRSGSAHSVEENKPVEEIAALPEPVKTVPSPAVIAETKDEMVPEKTAELTPITPAKTEAKSEPATIAETAPALPSPMADRPGKKNGIQTAMLSPAGKTSSAIEDKSGYRLLFTPGSAELSADESATLDKVVGKLNSIPDIRLQVRAYANGTPETASAARRLSLGRALKVREYLVQKNIVATRLDIRALGSGSVEMGDEVGRSGLPGDRVELIFVE